MLISFPSNIKFRKVKNKSFAPSSYFDIKRDGSVSKGSSSVSIFSIIEGQTFYKTNYFGNLIESLDFQKKFENDIPCVNYDKYKSQNHIDIWPDPRKEKNSLFEIHSLYILELVTLYKMVKYEKIHNIRIEMSEKNQSTYFCFLLSCFQTYVNQIETEMKKKQKNIKNFIDVRFRLNINVQSDETKNELYIECNILDFYNDTFKTSHYKKKMCLDLIMTLHNILTENSKSDAFKFIKTSPHLNKVYETGMIFDMYNIIREDRFGNNEYEHFFSMVNFSFIDFVHIENDDSFESFINILDKDDKIEFFNYYKNIQYDKYIAEIKENRGFRSRYKKLQEISNEEILKQWSFRLFLLTHEFRKV